MENNNKLENQEISQNNIEMLNTYNQHLINNIKLSLAIWKKIRNIDRQIVKEELNNIKQIFSNSIIYNMKLEDFNNIDKINNINDIFLTIILAIFITMIFYLLVPYNHYNLYFN